MNGHYVCIKVDREERPDVDAIYMAAVQALTQSGGWPMSVWLTPEREPFFGGTYFPPREGARGARHGFLELLGDIHQTYLTRRGARRARRRGAGARRARADGAGRARRVDADVPGAGAHRPDGRRLQARLRRGQRRSAARAEVPLQPPDSPPAARAPADGRRRRAPDGDASRWRRWPAAACTISSPAGFTATRPTPPGWCRTSRRCSTTTASWPWRTPRRSRSPGAATSRASRARRSTTWRAR